MEKFNEWWDQLIRSTDDREEAAQRAYQHLTNLTDREGVSYLAKVTLHTYICSRGCKIATVFRAGKNTLCAVRDYKYSPGLNERQSVEAARAKNTLDGNRHWPGHVFDVDQIAEWGESTGISMNCRHYRGVRSGAQILKDIGRAVPGRPGKPTRLGVSS